MVIYTYRITLQRFGIKNKWCQETNSNKWCHCMLKIVWHALLFIFECLWVYLRAHVRNFLFSYTYIFWIQSEGKFLPRERENVEYTHKGEDIDYWYSVIYTLICHDNTRWEQFKIFTFSCCMSILPIYRVHIKVFTMKLYFHLLFKETFKTHSMN